MGMISFIKTPKPRRFGYSPVFYDERKEALEERERQIRQEMGLTKEGEERVSLIKGQFRKQYDSKRRVKSNRKKRNLRLLVIFTILCLLFYYLIYF
ncbi:MAG TPA: hypothetical protein VFC87_00820 [Perlabentimonas sp.]|jgi:hypothetical protein|nr:hypothetical protein [Bacteroidales bacterium]MDD4673053.1 hypothetical protein [Bacteroidales bacterium]MDY0349354.1 hypothetical protein [Tenuifilaceae bacterium]HZJ73319.1 hypothetical protein [Perlabentimonas sp.]